MIRVSIKVYFCNISKRTTTFSSFLFRYHWFGRKVSCCMGNKISSHLIFNQFSLPPSPKKKVKRKLYCRKGHHFLLIPCLIIWDCFAIILYMIKEVPLLLSSNEVANLLFTSRHKWNLWTSQFSACLFDLFVVLAWNLWFSGINFIYRLITSLWTFWSSGTSYFT